jgi:hypothetical protein
VARYYDMDVCTGCWAAYINGTRQTSILHLGNSTAPFEQGGDGGGANIETAGTQSISETMTSTYGATNADARVKDEPYSYRDTPYTGTESGWQNVTASVIDSCQNTDDHASFDNPFDRPYTVFRYVNNGSPSC